MPAVWIFLEIGGSSARSRSRPGTARRRRGAASITQYAGPHLSEERVWKAVSCARAPLAARGRVRAPGQRCRRRSRVPPHRLGHGTRPRAGAQGLTLGARLAAIVVRRLRTGLVGSPYARPSRCLLTPRSAGHAPSLPAGHPPQATRKIPGRPSPTALPARAAFTKEIQETRRCND